MNMVRNLFTSGVVYVGIAVIALPLSALLIGIISIILCALGTGLSFSVLMLNYTLSVFLPAYVASYGITYFILIGIHRE